MDAAKPIQIEVYSDTICPWCFIGKRRFEKALLERTHVTVNTTWMPFQLNPDMPSEGMSREAYLSLKFGGAERARDIYAPIEQAGADEGIAFRFDTMKRTPNTLGSHRLIHYSRHHPVGQNALVEALFDAYFSKGEDIGDLDVLVGCAESVGMDGRAVRQYLESDAQATQVHTQDAMARQMGIQGVPFFVFERKYAVSGAHPPATFVEVLDSLGDEERGNPA